MKNEDKKGKLSVDSTEMISKFEKILDIKDAEFCSIKQDH